MTMKDRKLDAHLAAVNSLHYEVLTYANGPFFKDLIFFRDAAEQKMQGPRLRGI